MDAVFKALADESRRKLLDELHKNNGQTLSELCEHLDMTRQAVTKHLAVAGGGESGRRRLARAREAALSQSSADTRDLRALDWQIRTPSPSGAERFEKRSRRTKNQTRKDNDMQKPKLVYTTYIRSTPKEIVGGHHQTRIHPSILGRTDAMSPTGRKVRNGNITIPRSEIWITGKVLESTPPKRLVLSWADPDDARGPIARHL